MFKADRVFSQRNPITGVQEWFFLSREGTMGPYPSRDYTHRVLDKFIERCKTMGLNGGRLMPLEEPIGRSLKLADSVAVRLDFGRWAEGLD